MQRKFLSNLALLILLNVIVKPISIFGIDANVQNTVGSTDYGLYFSLLNFTYLFNILLDFGINNFSTKHVAQYPKLMKKYIGQIAGFRIVLFFVYAFFTLGLALVLGYSNQVYPILWVLILQQFLIGMIAFFRSYLAGLLLFKLDAILSVIDRILLIFLCGTMLYLTKDGHTFKIEHFIWIQFFCYLCAFVVGLLFVLRNSGKIQVQINRKIAIVIVRQSFPYALLIILMALFTRVDSVMIERMLDDGAKQAGIYAQGFRLLDAFFMFSMLFSTILLPLFSKMIHARENVNDLFKISAKLLIWGAVAIAGILFWNANWVLSMIYENDIAATVQPFQLLMLTFIPMCVILIYGTYLTALGDMKVLNIIAFIGLFINFGFNLYLIPHFGVVGAAFATLITQGIVAIGEVYLVKKQLKIEWKLTGVLSFITFSLFVFGGLYLADCYQIGILPQLTYVIITLLLFKVVNLQLVKELITNKVA